QDDASTEFHEPYDRVDARKSPWRTEAGPRLYSPPEWAGIRSDSHAPRWSLERSCFYLMLGKRSLNVVLGVCSVTIVALLLAAAGPAAARPVTHDAAKVTVISVTAGKPSELAFKLSKFSSLPAGTIVFRVTNLGLGFHNFKICRTPVRSAAKNACLGKVTKLLHHGDKATLTVTLTKNGKYEYLCAVSGHAAAGMKGLIGVGVSVPAPVTTTTTTTT